MLETCSPRSTGANPEQSVGHAPNLLLGIQSDLWDGRQLQNVWFDFLRTFRNQGKRLCKANTRPQVQSSDLGKKIQQAAFWVGYEVFQVE